MKILSKQDIFCLVLIVILLFHAIYFLLPNHFPLKIRKPIAEKKYNEMKDKLYCNKEENHYKFDILSSRDSLLASINHLK